MYAIDIACPFEFLRRFPRLVDGVGIRLGRKSSENERKVSNSKKLMKNQRIKFIKQSLIAACFTALTVCGVRADYKSTVLADSPKAYYRFNDNTNRDLININIGTIGAAGNASNDVVGNNFGDHFGGVAHHMPGAIVGDPDGAEFFDFSARTEIPFSSAVNTPEPQPFTLEAWIYPVSDEHNNGMGVLCNRYTQGPGGRQGWVMFQRAVSTNYDTNSGPGVGWNFRMYNGVDGSGHVDVTSGVPMVLGQWQHVVVVYNPVGGNPNTSLAIIYINGVAANTNINSNTNVPGYAACTGDHDPSFAVNGQPALSLGGYNNGNGNASNLGFQNPWTGGLDEFAIYTNILTPAQILAHYQNGTNAAPSLIPLWYSLLILRFISV